MGDQEMSIKEIAKRAGVSVATVSHVINKTRYVSPELTERVMEAIRESGSHIRERHKKAVRSNTVLCLVENLEYSFYTEMIKGIKKQAAREEFEIAVLHAWDRALVREFIRVKKPAGVIAVPDRNSDEFYKLKELNVPTVWVGAVKTMGTGNIILDHYENAYTAAYHLLKSGHDRVCFIREPGKGAVQQLQLEGFQDAMQKYGIPSDSRIIAEVDENGKLDKKTIEALLLHAERPTAIVSADTKATMQLYKLFVSNGIQCPEDISLVSLQDFELSDMLSPALTTIAFDPLEAGELSFAKLMAKLEDDEEGPEDTKLTCKLNIRSSTRSIGRGPLGEKAENPEVLELSAADKERIKSGTYTAAISFHYSGMAWSRLHEKGIRDVFDELGIRVLVVTDAHFDPELQVKQHESIVALGPDVLISIPTDEKRTAHSYRQVVNSGSKLVLIGNTPDGFERKDYASCISVNEMENGQIAGRILGEQLTEQKKRNIGLLVHGAPFFATKQRDTAVEQVLFEEFPGLHIAAIERFVEKNKAYDVCMDMIRRYPEIEGLYVSWEGPALEALRALKDLNRTDISVVTADLDYEIAANMAMGGPVKGLSAQRPYEQGRATALAAANALLGKEIPSFIGVTPYRITSENLLAGWQDVLHERPSPEIVAGITALQSRESVAEENKIRQPDSH
ncbi:hypothetical protein XYCOK13_42470 [Xylanibacillus composti]|uniref:LacI family DNA-binding transcriptional regulator n=2 Tax=Xylanibacillus composti TaxID=1572762 RepID=A0A8J4H930_9BACL|nr:hypothetical protein XYCOK13_42470 [Xylanibacillus composti]